MKTRLAGVIALLFLVLPALCRAAESLDIPEAMEKKVKLEGLSGFHLFIGQMYNDHLWSYALGCTVAMAVVGMAIAVATDWILKAMGMEVHKIEHKE